MASVSSAPVPPAGTAGPAGTARAGGPPPARRWRFWLSVVGAVLLTLAVIALVVRWEMRHSTMQARFLSAWAQQLGFEVKSGAATGNRYPQAGPYDERLGYTRLPGFVTRLTERHHVVTAQAQQSEALASYLKRGFFAPYDEKAQTGLRVQDCRGEIVYSTGYPQHVYRDAEAIPPLLGQALSFIENKELLHPPSKTHNPAVEWDRLGRAVLDQAHAVIDADHAAAGGSTLATQLEKFRHSPDGRTAGIHDKYLQMVSASVRAYRDGPDTGDARQRVLLDYVNGLPLGALRGYGEVNGVLDGLYAWYGADLAQVNRLLRLGSSEAAADPALAAQRGLAFRQVLSLFIAQRRPAHFFGAGQPQLGALTDAYVRLLANGGVIDAGLAQATLAAKPVVRSAYTAGEVGEAVATVSDRKAAKLVRTDLVNLLDAQSFYDLDRLDLRATSSIDGTLQAQIGELLRRLREPGQAKAEGLVGRQLLEYGDPGRLYYSFTLYERGAGANYLRVQTDNLDQPFDINTGAKLELGSTAKLRTLVTYLEIIAALHAQLSPMDAKALEAFDVARKDRLTRWAVDWLRGAKDRSLAAMLEAAMDRKYSASPGETFYTGGGEHRFENFDRADDGKMPNLREALRDSTNLVFIRLMRDVVYHHLYREPGSAARILEDSGHPDREVLLARFADREGAQFSRNFYRKLKGKDTAQLLEAMVSTIQPTPTRLAVIFRSLKPEAPLDEFSRFFEAQLPSSSLDHDDLQKLFERHGPGKFSLPDQGYLARVHPLELWVAGYLRAHPNATMTEMLDAGKPQRQEVYGWLFRTRAKAAQNRRILSLLEIDAFAEIHKAWQRLGYPFERLVPSYATSIGSSGDRPAALSELMGILVNEGMRLPTVQIETLRFAAATPYETQLKREARGAERVMAPEVAAVARRALQLVVDQGTARRLKGALDGPHGEPLPIGGKTGTGDNRINTYSARGAQTGSKVLNRTATFVFFMGDRHFGTITAFVPGAAAESFKFTSALPVQIVKLMAPMLAVRLHAERSGGCMAPDERVGGVAPRPVEPAHPAASAALGQLPQDAARAIQPVVAESR